MVALPKTDVSSLVATPLMCELSAADLRRATATLARICDKRSTMPMLQHVLVKVADGELVLAATDLNISVVYTTQVYKGSLHTNGSICVNAKAFADLVKGLSGEHVTLGQTGGLGLSVSDSQTNVTLIGMHSRDFPKLPVAKPETLFDRTEGVAFADMLDRVSYSICKDETRFHLNGILIESDGVTTRMVTTDGHRLTRHDAKLCTPTTKKGVILPSKAATEIGKIFKAHKTDTAYLAIEGAFLFGRIGGWSIAAKLIDAQFPAYEQVIPKDHAKCATVETKPLIAALKRAQKLTSKTRGVKLSFASGKLTLTCDHPEQGTVEERLKACSEWLDRGHSGVFGMNPSYLLDVLTEIGDKNVTLEFGDKLDPVLVRGTDDSISYSVAGSRFLGVIMPMRI